MRRFLTKRGIIVLLVLAAGLGWWGIRSSKIKNQKSNEKIVAAEKKDVVSSLTVSGETAVEKMATLNFPVSGKLGFVRVKSGDKVKAGEWLAGLNLGDLQAAEKAAYYSYLAADANAKEVEDSVKGHDKDETYGQKNDRVAAQTARDKAYESWVTSQRAVGNAILKSPIDGVVTEVTVSAVGDTVGTTDGVKVADLESLYFEIEIDEADLEKVGLDQIVKVGLDAFSDTEFEGVLSDIGFVSRLSDTGANVFPARVKIADALGKILRVGMKGDARIVLGKARGVITLPIEAIVDNLVEKPDGRRVEVEIGLVGDSDVEIKSGLNEGEKVIVR